MGAGPADSNVIPDDQGGSDSYNCAIVGGTWVEAAVDVGTTNDTLPSDIDTTDSDLPDSIDEVDPSAGLGPQGGSTNCIAGPLNLSQNMLTAKGLAGKMWSGLLSPGNPGGYASAIAAASAYVGLVQTGGPWDPKNWPGIPGSSLYQNYVAAGNINFGATCSQFGANTWLGGQVCQFGAGLYGKASGVYGSPVLSRSHGDIPSDNQQIRQGLAIAKKGGC